MENVKQGRTRKAAAMELNLTVNLAKLIDPSLLKSKDIEYAKSLIMETALTHGGIEKVTSHLVPIVEREFIDAKKAAKKAERDLKKAEKVFRRAKIAAWKAENQYSQSEVILVSFVAADEELREERDDQHGYGE